MKGIRKCFMAGRERNERWLDRRKEEGKEGWEIKKKK